MLAPVVVLHCAFACSSSAPARLQQPLHGYRRDEASRGAAPASLPRVPALSLAAFTMVNVLHISQTINKRFGLVL